MPADERCRFDDHERIAPIEQTGEPGHRQLRPGIRAASLGLAFLVERKLAAEEQDLGKKTDARQDEQRKQAGIPHGPAVARPYASTGWVNDTQAFARGGFGESLVSGDKGIHQSLTLQVEGDRELERVEGAQAAGKGVPSSRRSAAMK